MTRADFFCSKCGAYKDPQQLDYKTGECISCQDGMTTATKMYILILNDVPTGHAINSAAHASLACYVTFAHLPHFQSWLKNSFKKVSCSVTRDELARAQKLADHFVVIKESNLHNRIMGAAFAPRPEWDPFLRH